MTTTQYNNTSVISNQTIYGDLADVHTSTVSEAYSIAAEVTGGGPYDIGNTFTLATGTDGGPVSLPYPSNYIEVS